MLVSITQAHKMSGVARSTIYKDIKAGKLSAVEGTRGKRVLDVSELQRVYGDIKMPEESNVPATVSPVADRSEGTVSPQSEQVAVLQERIKAQNTQLKSSDDLLEKEEQERVRERQQLESRITALEDALKLSQEGHNKATLLLEHKQSGVGDWEKSFQMLEKRIANQENKAQKEIGEVKKKAHTQVTRYRQELEQERSKPFWQKLFGNRQTRKTG